MISLNASQEYVPTKTGTAHCKRVWPMKTILQGNSPQAAATAQKIEKKLEELNNKLQNAVVAQVAEDFMDTTTNLKQLEKAARAPPGEI